MNLKTTLSVIGAVVGIGAAYAWASLLVYLGFNELFNPKSHTSSALTAGGVCFIAAGVWTFLGTWFLRFRTAAPAHRTERTGP